MNQSQPKCPEGVVVRRNDSNDADLVFLDKTCMSVHDDGRISLVFAGIPKQNGITLTPEYLKFVADCLNTTVKSHDS